MEIANHRLKFNSSGPYNRLTILIVCPGLYTEPLKVALLIESKNKYDDRLAFSFCEHIEDILSCTEAQTNIPDYIVIIMDPKIRTCLKVAEECISIIDPAYITGGRLCFVNGSCSTEPSKMGVGLGTINVLAQKYSVILINGDVLIPEKCRHLASRILRMATTISGMTTGIPLIVDIPGYENRT